MKSKDWHRIEQLYFAALEIAEERRLEFLKEACGGDEDLRTETESLLESNKSAGEFLNSPAIQIAAKAIANDQEPSALAQYIPDYEIISLLDAGGMGEVYLAHDKNMGRKVALKLLPLAFTSDTDRVWRFEQEARAASALNHPNIITVYEIGHAGARRFIASEFIDGDTLRRHMINPIKLADALKIVIQICSALVAAHEAGIIHRDIKPENIMVRPDGYVKVLDFGLAKLGKRPPASNISSEDLSDPADTDAKVDSATMIATPRYLSPERILGQGADARSDIFSVGIVLYEMLSGRPPFAGVSAREVMAGILDGEPPPLTTFLPNAPGELERILHKALAKDREERYQVIKDLLIDLNDLKLELEVDTRLRRSGQLKTEGHIAPGERDARDAPNKRPTIGGGAGTALANLEAVGGAVPLDSPAYIVRPTDAEFHAAIARRDSIVLVKGARQVGKTSLLARGFERARQAGARIVLTDFQNLNSSFLGTADKLMKTLAESLADQLEIAVPPGEIWNPQLSPSINLERYLRREVLPAGSRPLVWGLDEVDRLFSCEFGSEVFGLFRSWHNKRALDPDGPWQCLTLAIAYATEAHLFITDLNQSPFNVGTRLLLGDFTFEQVKELNELYGSPLKDEAETAGYFQLVGGHPYLVRRGLYEMAVRGHDFKALESRADQDEGPFGDHLRRILLSLTQDAALLQVVRGLLEGKSQATLDSFYRLRSAGLITGDSLQDVRPRCELYERYVRRKLL